MPVAAVRCSRRVASWGAAADAAADVDATHAAADADAVVHQSDGVYSASEQ